MLVLASLRPSGKNESAVERVLTSFQFAERVAGR
jgi:hypothetical protein